MRMQVEKRRNPKAGESASGFLDQNHYQEKTMTNSTEACATRAITVPFHGADLHVVEHSGQPYTPMKPIVAGMGLDWAAQFSKLKSNPVRWGIAEIAIPTLSGVQVMICLPLRKLFGWLASINTGKIRATLRETVSTYQNECDDVLWQYWNDGLAINPRALYSVNPGDVLTREEADTLRQMVEGIAKKLSADTKVQGKFIMQAWSKLKSHFKVAYREIPRHELTEAISIVNRHTVDWELVEDAPKAGQEPTMPELVAKMVEWVNAPNGYPIHLFVPVYEAVHARLQRAVDIPKVTIQDASRTYAAFDAATRAAAEVQRTVFDAVMHGNDNWKHQRLLLAFITDSPTAAPAYVDPIEPGSFITSWPRLVDGIRNGECLRSTPELLDMAAACMTRLQQRSQRGAPPAIAH